MASHASRQSSLPVPVLLILLLADFANASPSNLSPKSDTDAGCVRYDRPGSRRLVEPGRGRQRSQTKQPKFFRRKAQSMTCSCSSCLLHDRSREILCFTVSQSPRFYAVDAPSLFPGLHRCSELFVTTSFCRIEKYGNSITNIALYTPKSVQVHCFWCMEIC